MFRPDVAAKPGQPEARRLGGLFCSGASSINVFNLGVEPKKSMELACPSCATHFTVPDGAIGAKGRKLKCSQCGHVWRQMPLEEAGVSAAPAAARAQEAAPPPPPAAEEVPPAGSVPLEMEPGTYAPSASTKQPDGDDFLSMDSDPFESLRRDSDLEDDPLAGLDLDSGSADSRGDDDSAFSGDSSFDSAELDDLMGGEADPIPSMFARGEDDDEPAPRRKSAATIWLLVALLVLVGLAGATWIFRERLVETVPALEQVFDTVGIPAAPLGHGLMFRDVTSDLVDRGNGQMLVLRGFIANESDRERPVPFLRLALFDRTGAMLEQIVAEPPQVMLDAGETVGFRIQADNPSAATQRFTVDWTEPPAGGGQ